MSKSSYCYNSFFVYDTRRVPEKCQCTTVPNWFSKALRDSSLFMLGREVRLSTSRTDILLFRGKGYNSFVSCKGSCISFWQGWYYIWKCLLKLLLYLIQPVQRDMMLNTLLMGDAFVSYMHSMGDAGEYFDIEFFKVCLSPGINNEQFHILIPPLYKASSLNHVSVYREVWIVTFEM